MYKMIYTRTLDHADDIVAESWEYEKKEDAVALFYERLAKVWKEITNNEFLHTEISVYGHKAFVKIQSEHHCFAVVDDMNKVV